MNAEEAQAAGWKLGPRGSAFPDLVGPFWSRRDADRWRHAALTDARHANNNGVVHGGLLLSFADNALGMTVWHHIGRRPCATIELSMQFVDAVQPGDLVELDAEIVRATRSVVFVRGTLSVADRTVATATGIWKILAAAPSTRAAT